MRIWAIADLHLSFGVPDKSMAVFGPQWKSYEGKVADAWNHLIHPEDLVLLAGDFSWALRLEEVKPDLAWLDKLPGTKVMIKGNHDFWWGSLQKTLSILPPSVHLIQNNAFHWKGVSIGGARLWDTPEYTFREYVEFQENPRAKTPDLEETLQEELQQKIFNRELQRLRLSLEKLNPTALLRIAMTHYPPIGADLAPSRAGQILEQHGIEICAFGHLHNIRSGHALFGTTRGVRYVLTSCDYLRFEPHLLAEI